MNKYCCFVCPAADYAEKSLQDRCSTCGKTYGFVLTSPPQVIANYTVTRALARGFYGAAYVAEFGPFKRKCVLKISPVAFYGFAPFKKTPFSEETELHDRLAQAAEHVVGIVDRFDASVTFTDALQTTIDCHVMVLEYLEGDPLRDYLDGQIWASSAAVCQIAIDLLRLRGELEAHHLNHNDLHAENLIVERLSSQSRRQGAIDDSIRVTAIDFGSLSDSSKSTTKRLGDLHFIAQHVDKLLSRLLADPSQLEDRDYRTALALQGITNSLLADTQNARHPSTGDLIREIEDAYYRASQAWRPWADSLRLKSFADHYNAQTLTSSDVPRLLVDPQNRWLVEVSKPGPQIITGMRGCGKTMLLRALDIHAQASERDGESPDDAVARLRASGFIGLFVSAQKLLDLRESSALLEQRLTRLYVHYSLQAARALLHLRDLSRTAHAVGAHVTLANGIADYLEGAEDLREAKSIDDLEARLEKIAVLSSRGTSSYTVRQAPFEVFQHLAERLRACSEIIASSTVLYLLDDVSTRYLELDRVEELLSGLLFQSPVCAFKFTSEWQTIELGLRSPGRIHPIREGRDLAVFDLGADVFETISESGKDKGNDFVAQVLKQRAQFHASHPKWAPRDMLGDVSLEQVARDIASSNTTSRDRKRAYRGLSCLTSVCVGDIGDVIKLYEEIIKRASSGRTEMLVPITDEIQAECFQAISSRRLFDLNRRGGLYKNHALAFAEAAHDLLTRSYRAGTGGKTGPVRLRQYSSMYVRVTSDDKQKLKAQIDQLRELIDAGVFVYSGGSPRTKTKDSDPIQQFKLSYRKIYGLASFIGLADRDRFELSGNDLEEWLGLPGKDVLLRNQIKGEVDLRAGSNDPGLAQWSNPGPSSASQSSGQQSLFEQRASVDLDFLAPEERPRATPIEANIREVLVEELGDLPITGVITGLGFEDRTLSSNVTLSAIISPTSVCAVRYSVEGHSDEILSALESSGHFVAQLPYQQATAALPEFSGLTLIDISGLSKPLIFSAIRRELQHKGRVLVAHQSAIHHYPLEADLKELFEAEEVGEPLRFLEGLEAVLKGEKGPYREVELLDEEVDLTRNRALLAFASAKHERLFSLLDKREFDIVQVMAPSENTPRARVARFAADFLCQNLQSAGVSQFGKASLQQTLLDIDRQYLDLYEAGANVELGLTGSKVQAVASAILSVGRKIAQAWYVSPTTFDEARFSTGVGELHIYDIQVPGFHGGD